MDDGDQGGRNRMTKWSNTKKCSSNFHVPNFGSRKLGSKYSMHKHVTVLLSELETGNGGYQKTDKS